MWQKVEKFKGAEYFRKALYCPALCLIDPFQKLPKYSHVYSYIQQTPACTFAIDPLISNVKPSSTMTAYSGGSWSP